jgi:hypothetical protein
MTSQGLGNIMSGMLAVLMLAEESNRTFCHYGYESFENAFDWKDIMHKKMCEHAIQSDVDNPQKNYIGMFNFGKS